MSECPDCGRAVVETMAEFWKNPSYSCPKEVPRTECNDDSWCELICAQATVQSLRDKLSATEAKLATAEAAYGKNCAACGAQWIPDSTLDKLSDLVEPYQKRAREAEAKLAELTAWWTKEGAELKLRVYNTELRAEAVEAKLAEAQLENRTAIALLKWARIGDRTVFLNSRGSFVASGDEEVNGRTARSLRGLAQKLGLVEKAGG